MFDFNTLAEFSRTDCIGICALLIPANLVATSLTVIFTLFRYSPAQVYLAAGIGNILAVAMLLHVFTWFMIGVVMLATYILLGLGSICLFTNLGAIILCKRFAKTSNYNPLCLAGDVIHMLVA